MASSSDEELSSSDGSWDPCAGITSSGARTGKLPLLAEDIELDDQDATVVFVFSRSQEDGGIIDSAAVKEDAKKAAERIFFMHQGFYVVDLSIFERITALEEEDGEVTEGSYQEFVRDDFLRVLKGGGIKAVSSKSIDGDEVFLKVSLPQGEDRLGQVAEFYRYRMPVKRGVLKRPCNNEGLDVPVFLEYSEEVKTKVNDFRQLDEIRLIMRWLSERINMDEMRSQKVLVRMFPGANYKQITSLSHDWANLWHLHKPASEENVEHVREYFGEKVAFFFLWFRTYKVQLLFLAIASVVVWSLRQVDQRFDLGWASPWVPNVFVIYLTLWVVSFNETFKRKTSRFAQHWGMKDWDSHEAETLSSYKPEQDGTRQGDIWKLLSQGTTMTYVIVFAVAILSVSIKNAEMRMHGDMRLAVWQPYIVSVLMKVCSFVWGKLAIVVVTWENHRTETRLDDSLAWTLASVKLFVALFPFVSLAFLESKLNQTCAKDLVAAAGLVYQFTGWPTGTEAATMSLSPLSQNVTEDHVSFLEGYSWAGPSGMTCLSGCYPVGCRQLPKNDYRKLPHGGHWECHDYCEDNIETQLVSFYFLQVVSAIVFMLIPIVMTKASIVSEILKVSRQRGSTCCALLRSLFGGRALSKYTGACYSLLQYQAKCHESAAYEYNSWGGSFVEDFLDVAIGYSLLACFSQLKPSMVVVGVLCHFATYRILAYRMLNVTCRPWPQGAEGIGIWQSIMDHIATLAVTCNVALSTFFMPPIKYYPLEYKFLFFIVAEKALLGLRTLIGAMVKDEPDDVTRLDDQSMAAEKVLTTQPLGESPKKCHYEGVDLGL